MLSDHDLVVVAGMPGAGKTTLLSRADNRADAVVLDSDQVRQRLVSLLPGWLPYRCYRPLVHLTHRARIAFWAVVAKGPVVAHEPATRASTRLLLVVIGALARRSRHLLWIRVRPEDARKGQFDRGRMIRPGSFERHVRRAGSVEATLRFDGRLRGWHSVRVLDRPDRRARCVLLRRSARPSR